MILSDPKIFSRSWRFILKISKEGWRPISITSTGRILKVSLLFQKQSVLALAILEHHINISAANHSDKQTWLRSIWREPQLSPLLMGSQALWPLQARGLEFAEYETVALLHVRIECAIPTLSSERFSVKLKDLDVMLAPPFDWTVRRLYH